MKEFERIVELNTSIQDHLLNGIIPFWNKRSKDEIHGGYYTNFDGYGNRKDMPEKYLNTQSRLIWWFSSLNRKYPSLEYKSLATHGVDFLLKELWDNNNGGFNWKITTTTSTIDKGKIVYGQSFAIYALAEYYLSTGDSRGLEYAEKTFDLLQKFAADAHFGGYYENLEEDWTPALGGWCAGDRKGLDTHMHLMEAFTTLYEASGKEVHKRKLLEIIDLICDKMVDQEVGCGLNQFDMAWKPIPAIAIRRTWNAEREGEAPANPTETTSYGHNTELVWLMSRALKIANESLEPKKEIFKKLLDNALNYGVDWEKGGIFRDGLRKGGAMVLEKEWWQHTEALVGFLDGFEIFQDPKYLDAFDCIWEFANKFMINHQTGEWRRLLKRDGTIDDDTIGNEWKVSYHSGRSMLECNERLNKLKESFVLSL